MTGCWTKACNYLFTLIDIIHYLLFLIIDIIYCAFNQFSIIFIYLQIQS